MSQADPSDPESCTDAAPHPAHAAGTGPAPHQDAPSVLDNPSAPLQPPLVPKSADLPQSNEGTATEDTAVRTDTSEGQTEPPADPQEAECDQAVSLEPDSETAEDDAEVCGSSFSTKWKCFQI